MKVFIRSAVLILALAGAAFIAVTTAVENRKAPPVQKKAEPTLSVKTLQAQRGRYRPALFLIGTVEARDYAVISAPIEGDVLAIAAREGEYFQKNAQLVKLDTRELELTAQAQQAQLDELDAQLQSNERNREADKRQLAESRRLQGLAAADHERNQTLFNKNVLPLKQLEQSEQTLIAREAEVLARQNQVAEYQSQERRLQAQKKAVQAQLAQTTLLLQRAKLPAPFAGRVVKVHTAAGARPARGAPLLDIFNPSHLRLRVPVAQRYAAQLKSGQVRVILDNNNNNNNNTDNTSSSTSTQLTLSFQGLEPRVEAGNSSIDAFFKLPNANWVLGEVRDVIVEIAPLSQLFAVPADAVYNDRFIYRVDAASRAEAVECQRVGLSRSRPAIQVLVRCPALADGAQIVANQLPNLLSGVLLKVIPN